MVKTARENEWRKLFHITILNCAEVSSLVFSALTSRWNEPLQIGDIVLYHSKEYLCSSLSQETGRRKKIIKGGHWDCIRCHTNTSLELDSTKGLLCVFVVPLGHGQLLMTKILMTKPWI